MERYTLESVLRKGAELVKRKGIKFNENDEWGIVYDTGITPDVLGYLSENDVTNHLIQIEQL
jgi:hypothetical protein